MQQTESVVFIVYRLRFEKLGLRDSSLRYKASTIIKFTYLLYVPSAIVLIKLIR